MRRMLTEEEILQIKQNADDITDIKENMNIMENIVDGEGHHRFVEWTGAAVSSIGTTASYCKASLSGSHLMFVLAGKIDDETVLGTDSIVYEFAIPEWILDKIYPITEGSGRIEIKTVKAVDELYSTEQSIEFGLFKEPSSITIFNHGSFTATADRYFRIQFDLLIDNEPSE